MRCQPGISWGYDAHVNLMRSSKGWLAVYYDGPSGSGEIIKIFKLKNTYEYFQMLETMAYWNYNTCKLCPLVKADIDYTS